jgi:hypothetical protein
MPNSIKTRLRRGIGMNLLLLTVRNYVRILTVVNVRYPSLNVTLFGNVMQLDLAD